MDTAFVDWNAQPEPAESVEQTSRDALRFPVMPDRAHQQAEGLRYREIATALGMPVNTVKVNLLRARQKLSKLIHREESWNCKN